MERQKGGGWGVLTVRDYAEGMDFEGLERAIRFGVEASGLKEGMNVRGLLGRGLKEAIIALGEGVISSVKDGKKNVVKVWWDESKNMGMYEFEYPYDQPTHMPNGTVVTIRNKNSNVKCPGFNSLYKQVVKHFALRDINNRREVWVKVEGDVYGGRGGGKSKALSRSKQAVYNCPKDSKLIEQRLLNLAALGKVTIKIWESPVKLDFAFLDPCSEAGLIVQTEGVPLDNHLFGFEKEEAAHFFFGFVDSPAIAERLRKGEEGLVGLTRTGLDWKNANLKELYEQVHTILKIHVERKRQELSSVPTPIPIWHEKRLKELCKLLNDFAKQELEQLEFQDQVVIENNVTTLIIKPEVGYALPGTPRPFTVYAPKSLIKERSLTPKAVIDLTVSQGTVELSEKEVVLQPHKQHKSLLTGSFKVVGREEGDSALIYARLGDLEDLARFEARIPTPRKKGKLSGHHKGARKGGLFERIRFDDSTINPPQRVAFEAGEIIVYLKFAPLGRYIRSNGEGMDTPKGSVILAELVAEAFVKEVARRKIESGDVYVVTGGEIDAYNNTVNQLMQKYLRRIHEVIVV